MDIKSQPIDTASLSKLFREQICAYVDKLSRHYKHISLQERHEFIRLHKLSKKEKYILAALALVSEEFDTYEIINEYDPEFTLGVIICQCITGNLNPEDGIYKFLDGVLKKMSDKFQEIMEEEWEEHYFSTVERWDFPVCDFHEFENRGTL